MNVEYVILEDKEYIIVEKLVIKGINYYILSQEGKKDICIRKEIIEENEKFLVGLDSEDEFNMVLQEYLNKYDRAKKNLFPIGSIVSLHDCTFKVMVIGYLMSSKDGKVYDYCGCRFPEGIKSKESFLCFDNENIKRVSRAGYVDEEAKELLDKLEAKYNN